MSSTIESDLIACTYAGLILFDDDLSINIENIQKILSAAKYQPISQHVMRLVCALINENGMETLIQNSATVNTKISYPLHIYYNDKPEYIIKETPNKIFLGSLVSKYTQQCGVEELLELNNLWKHKNINVTFNQFMFHEANDENRHTKSDEYETEECEESESLSGEEYYLGILWCTIIDNNNIYKFRILQQSGNGWYAPFPLETEIIIEINKTDIKKDAIIRFLHPLPLDIIDIILNMLSLQPEMFLLPILFSKTRYQTKHICHCNQHNIYFDVATMNRLYNYAQVLSQFINKIYKFKADKITYSYRCSFQRNLFGGDSSDDSMTSGYSS